MKKMSPSLHPQETHLSWAANLAAVHTRGPLLPFLEDMGIAARSFLAGHPEAVNQLCELVGESRGAVARNTLRAEERERSLRGEKVFVEFTAGRMVRFCPQCVLEDRTKGSPRALAPVAKLEWEFRHVRVCRVHQIPLQMRQGSYLRELSEDVPETQKQLERLAQSEPRRAPSRLQTYILHRLELDEPGPRATSPWLDGQSLQQGVRTTEMLGALVAFGSDFDLKSMTEADRDMAGDIG